MTLWTGFTAETDTGGSKWFAVAQNYNTLCAPVYTLHRSLRPHTLSSGTSSMYNLPVSPQLVCRIHYKKRVATFQSATQEHNLVTFLLCFLSRTK